MGLLLFRHFAESTILCLLMGAAASCLRRQSAAGRHTLWLIAISKFLLPTFLFTAAGARIAFVLPAAAWLSSVSGLVAAVLIQLFGSWPSRMGGENVTATSLALLTIWAGGSTALFAVWFSRLRNGAEDLPRAQSKQCDALEHAKIRLGFDAPIRLCLSETLPGPALVGIKRPTITFPPGLEGRLTDAEFEAVLLHELAHARRRDNLASAFAHTVVCLFWFHPLLWLAEQRMTAERERACDEVVIRSGTTPQTYVAALAMVCRFQLFEAVAGSSAATGSNLKSRFDRILAQPLPGPLPCWVRVALIGLAVCFTLLPMAGGYCAQCGTSQQTVTWRDRNIVHRSMR